MRWQDMSNFCSGGMTMHTFKQTWLFAFDTALNQLNHTDEA
jgi:hypothetical protein